MTSLPANGVLDIDRDLVNPRRDDAVLIPGDDVILDASVILTTISPVLFLDPGQVLGLAATGFFLTANDAAVVGDVAATTDSLEAPDADWQSTTLTITFDDDVDIVVVLGAGDDTIGEIITALEAVTAFAAKMTVVDGGAGIVRIAAREKGEHTINVQSTLATAYTAGGIADTGTFGDFRVIDSSRRLHLQDIEGTATDKSVVNTRAGHYISASLTNLTAAAKRTLRRRGSLFDGA